MAEYTSIGWCDATLNFWHGCQKVSEGCKFCYMYRDKEKYGQDGNVVKKTSDNTMNKILKSCREQQITRVANGNFEPFRIFTCSWSDFFIEEADPWRSEAWEIIRKHPQFVWMILTKRPERIADNLPADWGQGWNNVWLGVSAENQGRFDERVPVLCEVPARIRFVSAEPLLGPIDILKEYPVGKGSVQFGLLMNWYIIGGESGNDTGKYLYRRCELKWIFRILVDAKSECIPVFVKQLGTWLSKQIRLKNRAGDKIEEWPEVINTIKFQEFPK